MPRQMRGVLIPAKRAVGCDGVNNAAPWREHFPEVSPSAADISMVLPRGRLIPSSFRRKLATSCRVESSELPAASLQDGIDDGGDGTPAHRLARRVLLHVNADLPNERLNGHIGAEADP